MPSRISTPPPHQLSLDLSAYPKLTREQAGHIRHTFNLSSQTPGDWSYFGSQEPGQEWDDAYRYQLAGMAYGISVAHYHRLPALHGALKSIFRRLITQMLRREVWSYWFLTSHSGKLIDPSLTELRKPWADPVVRENIMYSGHLLLMTSLYGMLFNDDEFEKDESIVFNWNPTFWGMGHEKFVYSNRTLQAAIIDEMEKNNWVGVCCEPNLVFVVCNQFPLIAMRLNDSRDGTNIIDSVLDKYKRAFAAKKMQDEGGLFGTHMVKQDKVMAPRHGGHTAWADAFMNSWNSTFVQAQYDRQFLGFLTHINGHTRLQHANVAMEFRRLVLEEKAPADSPSTLRTAQEHYFSSPLAIDENNLNRGPVPWQSPTWGPFLMMLSELGKTKELDDLYKFADTHLNPTWVRGGLYYPRNDMVFRDADATEGPGLETTKLFVHMEPHSGNAGIAYGRLNVKDGMKQIWDHPWTKTQLQARPYLDGAGLESGIDFLRAIWDEDQNAMIVTMKRWEDLKGTIRVDLKVRNLLRGQWAVYIGGSLVETLHVEEERGDIDVCVDVGAREIDLVVVAA